jgi:WD40 repeat protein/predicted Ser/Thr protein kinase
MNLADECTPDGITLGAGQGAPGRVLAPGTVIKHYELIRELGAGGMGVVFLARDTRLGRLVAIKFLLEHTGTAAERILAEARVTAQCRHENIVVIYDVDEVDGYPYMVLEYIQGRTLRAAMVERARDTAAMAVELMLPVARALACAHEMGIVHRDLKPENILLADDGQVKVVDFGIAKQVATAQAATLPDALSPHREVAPVTQDGALVGTIPYMSPEQWLGEPLDARSDIWAAGLILFELLTGAHPLEPVSFLRLVQVAVLDTPMPGVREKRPDLGPLADVIDRCLKKHKDGRMGSARELVEALGRIGAERGNPALAGDEGPFAGLSAFQEADAARFFGRESDVAAAIGRLRNQQIIMIAGPSGAGKSSFVRAGVIPALKRAGRDVEAFVVRPGRRPLASLADVLAFIADTGDAAGEVDPETIADTLRSQPGYLGARLRSRCRRRGQEHRILLFVDQLEELYTLGIEPEERAAFCACLEGVADDASSPLRVVLAMRGDFLDRLSEERRFSTDVSRGLLLLPPVSREGLRNALVKPLETARYRFEDEALVEEMLDGLSGTRSPLPLLQFTATKLWEARDPEKRLLTREAYRALGGVAGALSTHADAVLSGMTLPAQRLARVIFTRLVTPERTRAIVRVDELSALSEDVAAVEQVVQHLSEARLLSIEAGDEREGKTVELTHESLIDRWAKLRQWLEAEEHDAQFLAELRSAAQQWEKNGEADGFLWRDRAALEAGQWLERHRAEGIGGLGKREQGYLEAVVRLSERTRRRRMQRVGALLAGLCLVVLVVSVLAVRSNREAARAEAEKAEAERNAARARNATRMAAARERQGDPTTVLALLREIEPDSVPRGWAELAFWARGACVASAVLVHEDVVTSAAWSPDGQHIVTASFDNTVRVWDADGAGPSKILQGHEEDVSSAAWSLDGRRIVSASVDKTVRVWSADGSGQPIILRGHEGAVHGAAFGPDGRRIVSASADKTVRVWTADGSGQPIILRGHEGAVYGAVFGPDGQHIVSASWDKTVRVWNADGSGSPKVLQGHDDHVFSMAFSPDGQRIVSASADKTVRIWNADGSGQPEVLQRHEGGVRGVAWSPDGQRIVSASWDKTVRIWDVDGSRLPSVFRGHDDLVHTAAFSPDGQRIVSASADKTVRVWNADGSGQPSVFRGHDDLVFSAAWSPDGRRIVSASWDKTVRVWNADGSGQPIVLRGHDDDVMAAAWSPDGQRIVSASWDKTVRIWNADGTGQPIVLRGHDAAVNAAAWSPDGRCIVSASFDKTVRVWNADGTGKPIVLQGHDAAVNAAAWSLDGRRIVSASDDMTVRVWNADGSGQALVFKGHEAMAVVRGDRPFSPDGQRIVSSSNDGTVRIWNADGSGEPIVLRTSNVPVNSASWSPDGKRIVAALEDHTIIVWNNLEPLQSAGDPRLWTATAYCMPLDIRRRLLDFPDEQSRADLERCQRRVAEARDPIERSR